MLCRMRLDLDGILEVAAVEKRTGKSKQITIANALRAKSAEEIAAGRKRIQELYETRGEMLEEEWEPAEDLEEEVVEMGGQVIEMPAKVRADVDAEIAESCASVRDGCSPRCTRKIARRRSTCGRRSLWPWHRATRRR